MNLEELTAVAEGFGYFKHPTNTQVIQTMVTKVSRLRDEDLVQIYGDSFTCTNSFRALLQREVLSRLQKRG